MTNEQERRVEYRSNFKSLWLSYGLEALGLIRDDFCPDVELNYSGTRWSDLKSFKDDFASAHARFNTTQHIMVNHLVDVDGDGANTFTYCLFRLIGANTEGGNVVEGAAWYEDYFCRNGAQWLIVRRHCHILWKDGNLRITGETAPSSLASLRERASQGSVPYLAALDNRLGR